MREQAREHANTQTAAPKFNLLSRRAPSTSQRSCGNIHLAEKNGRRLVCISDDAIALDAASAAGLCAAGNRVIRIYKAKGHW